MYDLKDKVCLVTGASAGIGASVVRGFLDEGAKHVAVLDVDVTNGEALEEELAAKHGKEKVKFYKCDVTSKDLDEAFSSVLESFDYIDIVVNNAGIMNDSLKGYEKEVAINVTALMTSSLKAYNLMRKDQGGKGGTIINISSIAGLTTQNHFVPVYAATKSAVLQFSISLGTAEHFTPSEVRVVTLCFGCTRTSLFDRVKMSAISPEWDEPMVEAVEQMAWQQPESAAAGLIHAYKHGDSGSVWLVTSGRPAENVTRNVLKGYEIMAQGVYS